ncbi:MAG: hypothetical protein WDW38_000734 [Sanguina aurantia]
MANYYHEARAQAKKLKDSQEDNKRRAERRAEVAGFQVETPFNMLVLDGRACKLHRNLEQHTAIEREEGLIPWNGHADHLIDRFDGRAMLDMYREPAPNLRDKPKTAEESKLELLLAFEAFRDVVALEGKGYSEPKGLAAAEADLAELRAAARVSAAASSTVGTTRQQQQAAAGQGLYGAVGFSYATTADPASSSDDESDGEGVGDAAEGEAGEEEEAEDERMDGVAEGFGIEDFTYRLGKALEQEGRAEALARLKPRKRNSRKKKSERARRAGNAHLLQHGPHTAPSAQHDVIPSSSLLGDAPLRPPPRHSSASDRHRCAFQIQIKIRLSRRTQVSHVAAAGGICILAVAVLAFSQNLNLMRQYGSSQPRMQYITEFAGAASEAREGQQWMSLPHRPDGPSSILEALPDRPDPAATGITVQFPVQAADEQGARLQESLRRQREDERHREREEERHRERNRDWGGHNRETERTRLYSHGREDRRQSDSRDRASRGSESNDGRTQQASSSLPGRQGSGSSLGGGLGGSGSGSTAAPTPTGAGATAKPAAAAPAETPAERLKRIMASQLNKQVQKDGVVVAQKRLQVGQQGVQGTGRQPLTAAAGWRVAEQPRPSHRHLQQQQQLAASALSKPKSGVEKERQARAMIERAATVQRRSPSPPPRSARASSRSRSRSPTWRGHEPSRAPRRRSRSR